MSAKTVRHFLFWTSIASWTLGWIIGILEQRGELPGMAAVDSLALWVLGAVLGTLWLVLAIIKLAARTFRDERARP